MKKLCIILLCIPTFLFGQQVIIKTKTNKKMDSRDILIGHINDGIDTTQIGDHSNKSILVRGCDPEMG